MRHAKNSILCPGCRRLVSRDERICPYCGIGRPGSWWKNNRLMAGLVDPGRIITLIIYVNVGMYVLSLLLNPRASGFAFNPLHFLSPDNRSLLILGSTGTVSILQLHRWWSLVSANYLHGSLLHIIFNMIALQQIGPLIIREYGLYRMFAIYTLGGVAGFILSFLAGIPFTIGASAAVCSLVGAALYYGRSRGGTYGDNLYRQVGGWAVSIFVFGLIVPGINNWGHGGGMAAGALLGYMLGYQERKRENAGHRLLGIGCAAVTILVLVWAALNGVLFLLLA
ncbi:MAG: rhomboid family intramembrane serine protease [Deltaproteobacteria bacterium]|nr:rhomboid family intramembrane serine protease [Deltaproteobacteria bacterium]